MPMKRKSEGLSVIKQFVKEVGAPDAIVSDMAKEQVSQDVCNFATLLALRYGFSRRAHLGLTRPNCISS